jgi:hypothetical protein
MIDYLKLKVGDIVAVKDSVIGKTLRVSRKIDDSFIQLIDLQGVVIITIEVVNTEYRKVK